MTEPVVFDHGRPDWAIHMEAVCFNSLLGGGLRWDRPFSLGIENESAPCGELDRAIASRRLNDLASLDLTRKPSI